MFDDNLGKCRQIFNIADLDSIFNQMVTYA